MAVGHPPFSSMYSDVDFLLSLLDNMVCTFRLPFSCSRALAILSVLLSLSLSFFLSFPMCFAEPQWQGSFKWGRWRLVLCGCA
eukprot:m.119664 g.119664  ORF g.119664 m.119664 type:complete len:83 (+) comp15477_c1_seq1:1199-1447(+)